MIKITDPTYSDIYFIFYNDSIYTVKKNEFYEFLEAVDNNDIDKLRAYEFNLKRLEPEEEHFHVLFEKIKTPLVKVLFHE